MKPGRELDALVAEKIFDAAVSWDTYAGGNHPKSPRLSGSECPSCGYDGHWDPDAVPDYSTDIRAAFEVVEKLRSMGHSVNIESDDGYEVSFAGCDEAGFDTIDYGFADTAPHAICLAALKAIARRLPQPKAEL